MNRRRFLAAAAVGVTSAFAGCSGTPDPVTTRRDHGDWPLHAHDTTNSNHVPAAVGPGPDPSVEWTRRVTDGRRYGYGAPSPVVADGTLYVGGDGLVALEAATGDHSWRAARSEAVYGPAVTDGAVYAGSVDGGVPRVRAFDRTNGERRWTVTYDEVLGPRFRPVVATDDAVYATLNYGTEGSTTPPHGRLDALADGDRRWSIDLGGNRDPAPAVRGTELYLGGTAGSPACAVDVRRGTVERLLGDPPGRNWTSETPISPQVHAVAASDAVYYGGRDASGRVTPTPPVTLDALEEGAVEWQASLGHQVPPPAVTPESVSVVWASTDDGTVTAHVGRYSHAGDRSWTKRFPNRTVWASPVATANSVYVATAAADGPSDPRLHAFDRAGGTAEWSLSLPSPAATMAVAGGRLFVGSWDGSVMAVG
ncbi:outer membrane protein assembly factor BamB family protein [Halostella salina]|uniref:outer membrane protein assembly factor BamB family protein n=1 Tax=Halostella salina TaxID=1547897 RepID=UPI000EF80292|nr:PQQ-binding-like beta-propeller repeat protein [Halostella salina]